MRLFIQFLVALALMLPLLAGCAEGDAGADALLAQHEGAFTRYLGLIEEGAGVLKSASDHQDADRAVTEMQAVITRMQQLRDEVDALEPLTNEQMNTLTEKLAPSIGPVLAQMQEGMELVVVIEPLKIALDPSMTEFNEVIKSMNSPTVEQREESAAQMQATPTGTPSEDTAGTSVAADEPQAPSAYILIQKVNNADPQLLVQQLQQVLPKTQVVKLLKSPDAREVKLEVTNTLDLRALANKITFAKVKEIDDRTRTIVVDLIR